MIKTGVNSSQMSDNSYREKALGTNGIISLYDAIERETHSYIRRTDRDVFSEEPQFFFWASARTINEFVT